ncbi:MraY family glycosyltransferase [Bradyrhizobium archetypum]|uniref:Glycosyltransferase family 4 protein n=1 Tax=Bradyrhizobium archetypum TaxID=2721160 RepID=A0A7Y4H2K8_9BRAD|nr:glycosyltransferase family 4 protein [Bradyrhizobium archetypum]NOJ45537.1 glycosyltransferase family 4 protein [Bradyrhizobium archetypum]
MANSQLLLSFAAVVPAALLSAVLTWAIRPLMMRIAMAKPNARSSHRIPTPQGAGIAVIAATMMAAAVVIALADTAEMRIPVAVFGATLFIAAVGFADDVNSIPVAPRLLLQGLAVLAVILAAPESLRIVPACPLWIERGLLLLAGLWFVNLVNFMDGLDLMTAAEIVPVTGALIVLGWLVELPTATTVAAAALFGAMLGFAPFNRPVAKIFLGDVGSLPIGLLVGWCLLQLAWHQHVTAALLLPLYYLADATVTLLRRIARGEPFWAGHRSHFYQRATDNGFSVWRVVSEVFALNLVLAALAIGSVMTTSTPIATLLFVVGSIATALLMHRFSRRRPSAG